MRCCYVINFVSAFEIDSKLLSRLISLCFRLDIKDLRVNKVYRLRLELISAV